MDDVLPKPFTKKSLLDMLEKHLGHLKKLPEGMEAPPSATAPSMTQTSASQSVKDDSSPGQSPATSMNNWQSPNQYPGVSPIHANVQNQYLQAQTPSTYTIDQNGVQYQTPQTPISATRQGQHRRQVSEMSSSAEMTNFPKRQRMYAPGGGIQNPMQTARPG
jgi:osomolarity two-component system, response regulator SKN7